MQDEIANQIILLSIVIQSALFVGDISGEVRQLNSKQINHIFRKLRYRKQNEGTYPSVHIHKSNEHKFSHNYG